MAAIYSNGGNRWNILDFNFAKTQMRYLVYTRYLCCHLPENILKSNVPGGRMPLFNKSYIFNTKYYI
jgi:hypothetical protein